MKRKANYNLHLDNEQPPKKKQKMIETTSSSNDLLDLSSIYKDCVKMGTMNKINQKNAWSLHLLDYIDTVCNAEEKQKTKKKQRENPDSNDSVYNFQFASNTLDASIKIYACRVDNVHNETYKVLGGLARSDKEIQQNENNNNTNNINIDDEELEYNETTTNDNKKTRKRRLALGSTLEKNISNINMKKVDTAIRVDPLFHKTSAAFDEGGAKGLLLSQLGVSEGGNIVFDSSEYSKDKINFNNNETYSLNLIEKYIDNNWNDYNICNDFTTFSFKWDKQDNYNNENTLPNDIDTIQEDNSYTYDSFNQLAENFDNNNNYQDFDNEPMEQDNNEDNDLISKILGAGSILPEFDLINVIGEGSNEFDYFNKTLVQNWAGPEHWNFSKTRPSTNTKTQIGKIKRKKRKEIPFIDFFSEGDINTKIAFKKPRSSDSTTLSLQVLETPADTLLPPDVHYKVEMLTKLFVKPEKSVGFRRIDDVLLDEDSMNNDYSYNNEYNNNNEYTSFNEMDNNFDSFPSSNPNNTTTLINEPDKLHQTHINYSKKATTVDIEKLKTSIWKELGTQGKITKEEKLEKPVSFSTLLNKLPNTLPDNQTSNVSVPLCFICLLDLANKKQLQIDNEEKKDLIVKSYIECN